MSIYNQLEILRSTKISLNSSIESLGEDLTNKIFGDYSVSVTRVYQFLLQLDTSLGEIIDTLTANKNDLVNLDNYMSNGNSALQTILDPVEQADEE